MPFLSTPISGLIVFEPRVFEDDRGYFLESYNEQAFHAAGITAKFVQDNEARSTRGILRGLHYQVGAAAQAKLVRVTEGEVLDIAVDLRPDSATYGLHFGVLLSVHNHHQLFVPRGFAHGYVVLSDTAIFQYKCDNFYNKSAEGGLLWSDPTLAIDWQIDPALIQLSEKDLINPVFGQHLAAL